jgi:hypothetical protein
MNLKMQQGVWQSGSARSLWWRRRGGLLCLLAVLLMHWPVRTVAAPTVTAGTPIPVLAYYYIWFDAGSWNRAKTDYPALGRYSSDDAAVMRQHVRWAKQAGIDGFIVSWKSTPILNRRLEQLIDIAEAEDFKLSIIYQGLDFERRPLPPDRIAADLGHFIDRYANRAPFDLFDRPLVIWSGTWEFSRDDLAKVTAQHRGPLLILASERNAADYERVGDLFDGNAYYWSSVNPETFPAYQDKLNALASAVHDRAGFWIAPAAPGFDARLIGGTRVVERRDGATLRQQMNAALQSSPDAVGLISWNEFSENSHVEPSLQYGTNYLEVLADIQGAQAPIIADFDSSEPAGTQSGLDGSRVMALGGLVTSILITLVVIARRQMANQQSG